MEPKDLNDNGKRSRESGAKAKGAVVTFVENNLEGLKEYWGSLSGQEKEDFRARFGRWNAVMNIDIDKNAIRTLVNFFDPKFRCFILPQADMVPTPEEFNRLTTNVWTDKSFDVYTPDEDTQVVRPRKLKDRLRQEFGLNLDWTKGALHGRNGVSFLRWHSIYKEMKKDKQRIMKSSHRVGFFALGVFGLVLFPSSLDSVDHRVLDMVVKIGKGPPKNITPTLVAEILRSCVYIKEHPSGQLKCCTQLLTLWVHSHFPVSTDLKYHRPIFNFIDLIQEFVDQEKLVKDEEEWFETFLEARNANIQWCAPWMKGNSQYVVPPKNENWMPLFGVYGVISYSPSMVVRQFGSYQRIPRIDQIDALCYDYALTGKNPELEPYKKQWKECTVATIEAGGGCHGPYMDWRDEWVKERMIPKAVKPTLRTLKNEFRKELGRINQAMCLANAEISKLKMEKVLIEEKADASMEEVRKLGESLEKIKKQTGEWKERALKAERKVDSQYYHIKDLRSEVKEATSDIFIMSAMQEEKIEELTKKCAKAYALLRKAEEKIREKDMELAHKDKLVGRLEMRIEYLEVLGDQYKIQQEQAAKEAAKWKEQCEIFKNKTGVLDEAEKKIVQTWTRDLNIAKREYQKKIRGDLPEAIVTVKKFLQVVEGIDNLSGSATRLDWLGGETASLIVNVQKALIEGFTNEGVTWEIVYQVWDQIELSVDNFQEAVLARICSG